MASGVDPVILSYLEFLKAQQAKRWDSRVVYRDYAAGENPTQMTDDQKILLVGADANGNPNSDPEFNINVSKIIIKAESDRLAVRGIQVTVPEDSATQPTEDGEPAEESLSDKLSKAVWGWWEQSGMNADQTNSYFSAGRDADAYPIVDYDKGYPRITTNQAYDGESGTEMAYEDGHPNQPLYAAKRWTIQRPVVGNAKTNRVYRMNLYFDNRIEFYISAGMTAGSKESGWRRLAPGDRDYVAAMLDESGRAIGTGMREVEILDPYNRPYTATVVWLTVDGTPDGEPIGNPVKHMRHDADGGPYGNSRIADIAPGLADAVNRAGISTQNAQLLNGFKETVVTGFIPKTDKSGKSNALKKSPGSYQYIESSEASVSQLGETDLNQLIAVLDKWIVVCATLTSTPLSLFNLTAHTPAEGTQKQLESALVTSVEQSQRAYTATWQDAVIEQIKFDTLYAGEESVIPLEMYDQIDDFDINIIWEPAETRNELEERNIAVIDTQQLGVPQEFIWKQFYSEEQIAEMEQMVSLRQGQVLGQMAQNVLAIEEQNAARLAAGEVVERENEQQPVTTTGNNGANQ
jgi:hypothetical protein